MKRVLSQITNSPQTEMIKMESSLNSTSGRIAFFAVMTALTTIANLIMVPMPQPLAEYDLSPVLISL